ncbi:MAG: hypothetical protein WKG32_07130 [Gemmatimonadaceae bacterium]
MRLSPFGLAGLAVLAGLAARGAAAQQPAAPAASSRPTAAVPSAPGQDAYGAIAEIVRILERDSATDWSKVRLEELRQHLIDMNDVTLRATTADRVVPGGVAMDVTGAGRTADAIRRMLTAHTASLNAMPELHATTAPIRDGIRFTVLARRAADSGTVARLRGLGFIGLLTVGAHHQQHHLALARGQGMAGHTH